MANFMRKIFISSLSLLYLLIATTAHAAEKPVTLPEIDQKLSVQAPNPEGIVKQSADQLPDAQPTKPAIIKTTTTQKNLITAHNAFDKGLYKTAAKLAKREFKAGSADAAFLLGEIYRKGFGTQVDIKQALSWYRKAANMDHSEAAFTFGYALSQGIGLDKNISEAKLYFQKAAKADHLIAQYNLAIIYAGLAGQAADYTKAFKWFKRAADNGHHQSQVDVSTLYSLGKGIKQNHTMAARYMQQAAQNGRSDAMVRYAIMAFNGKGIDRDLDQAVFWLKKAANLGQAVAQTRLSRLYYKGVGVRKDASIAVMLYRLALKSGAEDSWLEQEFNKLPKEFLEKGQKMANIWTKATAQQFLSLKN
ncbi:MAG: hypothetical protein COB24_07160 [Hyphomicrobiales bacterium]|nr:MAG: hypothetical protein COB24_07160 [Hyphomicrobiales bacterium]